MSGARIASTCGFAVAVAAAALAAPSNARTELARDDAVPTLAGPAVIWTSPAPGGGIDVHAATAGGAAVAHEPPLQQTGYFDQITASASTTMLAALHRQWFYTPGKSGAPVSYAFELRAGRYGSPTSTIERCLGQQPIDYALAGATLAYQPADCAQTSPPAVAVRDLSTGGRMVQTFSQPAGTVFVSTLRLAGPYVAWIRWFTPPNVAPYSHDPAAEIVIADVRTGLEVLRIPFRNPPETFALQSDGKVAFAYPGCCNIAGIPVHLGWAALTDAPSDGTLSEISASSPPAHALPGVPHLGLSSSDGLAIANDRIAFIQASSDVCEQVSDQPFNLVVSDLAGRMAVVGPAGQYGQLAPDGFDGTNITWLQGGPSQGIAIQNLPDSHILLQNLASEPPLPLAAPPPCKHYIPPIARMTVPAHGVVSPRGRVRVRLSCLDRAGPAEIARYCEGGLVLRRPGRSVCSYDPLQGPPARVLLGNPPIDNQSAVEWFDDVIVAPGRTRTVWIELTAAARRKLRAHQIRAEIDWCDPFARPAARQLARTRLTLATIPHAAR